MSARQASVSCDPGVRPTGRFPLESTRPHGCVRGRRLPRLGEGLLALALLLGSATTVAALQKEGDRVTPPGSAGESPRVREAAPGKAREPREREANRIIVQPPRHAFRVSVWTDRPEYQEGDSLRIYFRTTADADVYVFNTDARGVTRQIFPNYYDRRNRIEGDCTYSLPDRNYSLVAGGPAGRETVEIVAVSERVVGLDRYGDFHASEPYPLRSGGRKSLMEAVERANRNQRSLQTDERKSRSVSPVPRDRERAGIIVLPEPNPVRTASAETRFQILASRTRPPERRHAVLRIFSYPAGAEVAVNGAFTGTTPLTVELPLGRHELRVTKEGYRESVKSVLLNSPFSTSVQFPLQLDFRNRAPQPRPGQPRWQWGP